MRLLRYTSREIIRVVLPGIDVKVAEDVVTNLDFIRHVVRIVARFLPPISLAERDPRSKHSRHHLIESFLGHLLGLDGLPEFVTIWHELTAAFSAQ